MKRNRLMKKDCAAIVQVRYNRTVIAEYRCHGHVSAQDRRAIAAVHNEFPESVLERRHDPINKFPDLPWAEGCAPEPAKPEPRFKVGDKVRAVKPNIIGGGVGCVDTIVQHDPGTKHPWRCKDHAWFADDALEPYTPDPVREAAQALVDEVTQAGNWAAVISPDKVDALRDALAAEVAA